MKRLHWIFGTAALALCLAGCDGDRKAARERLDKARTLYETGDFLGARSEIDSVRALYPKEVDALREALTLSREVEMGEARRNIAYCDSLLPIKRKEAEELTKGFTIETNPEDLPRLYKACCEDGADMSIGSRYCNGINVVNWPMSRILISYCASIYVRTVLGFKIYDSTAGFVCYSRRVLEAIDLSAVRMKGYGFQIEMKYTARRLGFKIAEVPVIFVNRQLGTSKMSGGIFGEAFWGVLGLRFRKIRPAR